MKNWNRALWGLLLVAVGVLLGLRAFGVEMKLFFDGWWTLFIIVPCVIGLFSEGDKLGNLIGIAVGVFLLLCSRDVLEFSILWKLVLPAVVVVIGLKMVFDSFFHKKSEAIKAEMKSRGQKPRFCTAAFSGQQMGFHGEEFHGANLTAVFGGIECDLRGAIITCDCVIEVCAVFGGVDIFVPDGVNVKCNATAIFGGMEDQRRLPKLENAPTIYIQGAAIFGGVDIK